MNIAVLGAGSWGSALADLLARAGHEVTLWAYEPDLVTRMQKTRCNDLYLPGVELAASLDYCPSIADTVQGRDLILLVPPSQVLRQVFLTALPHIGSGAFIVSASKGVENRTLKLMSEILAELGPEDILARAAFLSGPSFAREVVQKVPTAVAAASEVPEVASVVQDVFSTDYFRVYTNNDVIGVEIGGALKNVMALAAGVSDGLGFGHNTRAALITRGLAEMTRIGLAKGADAATFAGLAGMGDLVLTCTGELSRNRSVGIELGRGKSLDQILAGMQMVAEGVKTTESAWELSQTLKVETPIISEMYKILYEGKVAKTAVIDLMQRDLKPE